MHDGFSILEVTVNIQYTASIYVKIYFAEIIRFL